MKAYLFHVTREDRAISDLHILMCADDATARTAAEGMLLEQPRSVSVEVCEGVRTVATVGRPAAPVPR